MVQTLYVAFTFTFWNIKGQGKLLSNPSRSPFTSTSVLPILVWQVCFNLTFSPNEDKKFAPNCGRARRIGKVKATTKQGFTSSLKAIQVVLERTLICAYAYLSVYLSASFIERILY